MQWQRIRDRASAQVGLYLPVAVMALIAMGSWWLLRNAPSNDNHAAVSSVVREAPDYFMENFTVKTYSAAGQLQNALSGAEMLHYPNGDTFTIATPQFVSFDEQGREMKGNANKATSNGDGSRIELFEQAQIHRASLGQSDPPLNFKGEHLRVLADVNQVQSDRAVVLQHGRDTFKGGSLRYDHNTGQAQLGGPVTAMLPPSSSLKP